MNIKLVTGDNDFNQVINLANQDHNIGAVHYREIKSLKKLQVHFSS